jgi:hypothetical protein
MHRTGLVKPPARCIGAALPWLRPVREGALRGGGWLLRWGM